MSAPHPLRPETAAQAPTAGTPATAEPTGANSAPTATPAASPPAPATAAGDRVTGLLAQALALEAGAAREAAPAHQAEAERLLGEWSFRHLHNHAEQIRQEAARGALAGLRPPPSFLGLVAAGVLAVLIAAGLIWVGLAIGLLPHTLPAPR